jgi:hypothetical protein
MADKLAVIQSEETIKELKAIDEQIISLIKSFNELQESTKGMNQLQLPGKLALPHLQS